MNGPLTHAPNGPPACVVEDPANKPPPHSLPPDVGSASNYQLSASNLQRIQTLELIMQRGEYFYPGSRLQLKKSVE